MHRYLIVPIDFAPIDLAKSRIIIHGINLYIPLLAVDHYSFTQYLDFDK
jgi:hypothetical protein